MLVPLSRAVAFLTLLALAAPLALASPLHDVRDNVPEEAQDLPTVEDVPTDDPASLLPPIERQSLPVDVREARGQAIAARDTAVATAIDARDTVTGMLPSDPVSFVMDQAKPVRDTADDIQTFFFPTPAGDAQPPAPSATIEEVAVPFEDSLLVASATAAAAAALAILWLAGSSGSVGAGAAGASAAGGKLAAADLKRLLPFASPLFTRFEKDTVLGHPKREALYALILQSPGVSLQSLCDSTGLSRTAVTHHLRLLELQHLVVSKRMGRSRHYYENGGRFGRDQKEALAILQNPRSKEVASFVKQNPGAIQKAVCQALGLQPSIAHWHLQRLQQAQIVESVRNGRTVSYFPGTGLQSIDHPVVPPTALLAAPTAV